MENNEINNFQKIFSHDYTNDSGESSFSVKNNLALNKHWLDALLDYSPTILRISIKKIKGQKKEFFESLRREDFHDLKYFQLDGNYRDHDTVEIFSCMNLSNFNLRSLVLRNLGAISHSYVEEFCLKQCGNIEQLELDTSWDGHWWEDKAYEGDLSNLGSFAGIISRTGSPMDYIIYVLEII